MPTYRTQTPKPMFIMLAAADLVVWLYALASPM